MAGKTDSKEESMKLDKNTFCYIITSSAIGALGVGLVLLKRKVDTLDKKVDVSLTLHECDSLLMKAFNNDVYVLSKAVDELKGEKA